MFFNFSTHNVLVVFGNLNIPNPLDGRDPFSNKDHGTIETHGFRFHRHKQFIIIYHASRRTFY